MLEDVGRDQTVKLAKVLGAVRKVGLEIGFDDYIKSVTRVAGIHRTLLDAVYRRLLAVPKRGS